MTKQIKFELTDERHVQLSERAAEVGIEPENMALLYVLAPMVTPSCDALDRLVLSYRALLKEQTGKDFPGLVVEKLLAIDTVAMLHALLEFQGSMAAEISDILATDDKTGELRQGEDQYEARKADFLRLLKRSAEAYEDEQTEKVTA